MNYSRLKSTALSVTIVIASVFSSFAQEPGTRQPDQVAGCNRLAARQQVQEQIAEVKTIDDLGSRVRLLASAADLIWPSQEDLARAALKDAYEFASQLYREQGDGFKPEPTGLYREIPDMRMVVVREVAKHDAEWAKKLTERLVEDTKQQSGQSSSRTGLDSKPEEKFLRLASSIAKENKSAALALARQSLNYPISRLWSGATLYALANSDRASGDQFFKEALVVYARGNVEDLLYLSFYPFAAEHPAGPDASSVGLTVPPGFSPNPELIALYLDVLVARAQQAVRSGGQAISGSHKLPEAAQLYSALRQIEDQVLQKLPSYFNRVRAARDALEPLLGSESRQQIDQLADRLENLDRPSFSTLSERAEKERDPGIRDRLYVEALLAGGEQSIEELEKLASKIDETRTREQALAWFYFDRAQRLAKAGEFDLAIKLARKVPDLDRRAFLFFEIASAIERKLNDRVRMRETLDELISTASKASKSSEKARALLGAVHLYAKFDALRAFEVMNDAIKVINSIEQKDLTDTSVTQIIEGRKFTRVGVFVVEGFSLENVFRELGRADYFGALSLTKNLEDKPQRIATVIALAASCLEKPAKTRSLN